VAQFLASIAANIEGMDRETLKDFLSTLVEQITLDPSNYECQIHYHIGLDLRNKVPSPRGLVLYTGQLSLPWVA
jgi:hypothetical protein